jgi:predicted ATPase
LLGEPAVAYQHGERCFILSEEHGFRQWRSVARAIRGICTAVLKPSSDAIDQVVRGLDEYLHTGYQFGITALFVPLCEVLLLRRRFDVALEVIEQGLATCDLNSERFFEAEMYRLKAQALLIGNESNAGSHTQSLLDKALTIARSQNARSLELRAALDLARLWHHQGKQTEARHLLAPIYSWFAEGFNTPVLKEAKALLEQLKA